MRPLPAPVRRPLFCRQQGVALIALLALVILAFAYLFASRLTWAGAKQRRAAVDTAVLAQARDALIAAAMTRANQRPGELRCPDRDNDGDDDGNCSAGELGRIPWATLGIPPPRDAAGEILWYAIAGPFRNRNMNANPINSGTRGNLVVYDRDGIAVLADDVVFMLFAPGPTLPGQDRSDTSAPCPYDGATKKASLCPTNYLDSLRPAGLPPRNNAVEGGPFVAGGESASFNDRVLYVRTAEFIGKIERRVTAEASAWLLGYRAANGRLPFPAAPADPTCQDTSAAASSCAAASAVCSGRFPKHADPEFAPALTSAGRSWFIENAWSSVVSYAAGAAQLESPPPACPPDLTVDGNARAAVIIAPGARPPNVTWPSNLLSDYLEDAQNQDAWGTGPGALDFVTPSPASNDRLLPL